MASCDTRELMHGPADPQPVPVCETCGSDNVFYQGGNQGYCYECQDNREVVEGKS